MRVIEGPQTVFCPEMFSINFWHQRKNRNVSVFFSHAKAEKSRRGPLVQRTRTSLKLLHHNSNCCSEEQPPLCPALPRGLRPPGYTKEKKTGSLTFVDDIHSQQWCIFFSYHYFFCHNVYIIRHYIMHVEEHQKIQYKRVFVKSSMSV